MALTVAAAKLPVLLSYLIVLLAPVVSSPLMEHIDHRVKTFGADFSFHQNCSPHSVYVLTFLTVLSQPPRPRRTAYSPMVTPALPHWEFFLLYGMAQIEWVPE